MDNKDIKAASGRRRFLQKTATGAVIASLPAKSVWGACSVSGALSGNLSQNTDRHDCTIPRLSNGRSPGGWKNYENKIHSIFTKLHEQKNANKKTPQTYQKYHNCYVVAVEAAKQLPMTLPVELADVVGFEAISHTVSSGLSSNGRGDRDDNIYYHLAAVYLNAFFGLYPGYQGQQDAEELIKTVYLYYIQQNGIRISDLGYSNDGSTSWEAPCII